LLAGPPPRLRLGARGASAMQKPVKRAPPVAHGKSVVGLRADPCIRRGAREAGEINTTGHMPPSLSPRGRKSRTPPVSRAQVKFLREFADPRLARRGLNDGARFTGSKISLPPQVSAFEPKAPALIGRPWGSHLHRHPPCPDEYAARRALSLPEVPSTGENRLNA